MAMTWQLVRRRISHHTTNILQGFRTNSRFARALTALAASMKLNFDHPAAVTDKSR